MSVVTTADGTHVTKPALLFVAAFALVKLRARTFDLGPLDAWSSLALPSNVACAYVADVNHNFGLHYAFFFTNYDLFCSYSINTTSLALQYSTAKFF